MYPVTLSVVLKAPNAVLKRRHPDVGDTMSSPFCEAAEGQHQVKRAKGSGDREGEQVQPPPRIIPSSQADDDAKSVAEKPIDDDENENENDYPAWYCKPKPDYLNPDPNVNRMTTKTPSSARKTYCYGSSSSPRSPTTPTPSPFASIVGFGSLFAPAMTKTAVVQQPTRRKKVLVSSSSSPPSSRSPVQMTLALGQRPRPQAVCRDCNEMYTKGKKEDEAKHAACYERSLTITFTKLTIAEACFC